LREALRPAARDNAAWGGVPFDAFVEVIVATWQAGGATQVAISLGRGLAQRGHRVRIFGPVELAARIAEAGCLHRPSPRAVELDQGRPAEDQWEALREVWFGRELADAFIAELEREPADAVVVDYLLRSVAAAAELVGTATALLVHTIYGFHGGAGDDDVTRQRWYEPVNASRVELGLEPLATRPDSVTVALIRRAGAAIVAIPREFDDWPDPPANVAHVGPLPDEQVDPVWDSPWADDDVRPLIVVSLGTTYMAHEAVLGRIAESCDPVRFRVLVCTGDDLSPEQISVADGVEVRAYVPHAAVLPGASLVVTHAGTGTLLAAFGASVPVVCLPLGRDQPANAQRVVDLGLGYSLLPDSSPAELRAAIEGVLADEAIHDRVQQLAAAMRDYRGAAGAAETIERLVETGGR
jgi:UDP:flavonoid glycosyltransferase YjiC (YdhE family)